MKEYDIIIVGCGPAGSAAAKVLKDNNINFCMIDKSSFPREKLCGGGLTHKSSVLLNKLNFNLDSIDTNNCKEVQLVAKNINRRMILTNKIVMIDRYSFDYNILKQGSNDNLFLSENIISIDNNILITDKDKYKFKYIIFADGVNGYSRKLIKNRKFGFCVEYDYEKKVEKTVLDFCAIKDGYGWIFPKTNHATIGLGNFAGKKDNYQELLVSFGKKYNIEIDKSKIKGYPIPLYSKRVYKNSVIDNKYILVGDASSLVDPVSGEGIYYALASGYQAALSIINCIKNNKDLKKEYFKNSKYIYKGLNRRRFLSKMLYSRLGMFYIKLGLSTKYFIKQLNKIFG